MDLSSGIEAVNKILAENLPNDDSLGKLTEAMTYSVLNGGKRLRAIMLIEAAKLYSEDSFIIKELVEPFAAAIEFIHAYSLVHDDLPAMDNDVLRRGMPTTHIKYGHAMGVLTGDALLNYAFEKISEVFAKIKNISDMELQNELFGRVGRAFGVISSKPGYKGMIGGQVIDTAVDYPYSLKDEYDENTINDKLAYGLRIYELKTSQLIEVSLMCGAILGGADNSDVDYLEKAGYALGLAFQIQDDILDMTSSAEILGKSVNIDEKNEKPTVARIVGLDRAKDMVSKYTEESVGCLKALGRKTEFLEELFLSLINRNK